jgi:cytochrome P450
MLDHAMTSALATVDSSIPVLDVLHPDFVANPIPMIDRMLREQPIAFDPRLGGWLIGSYSDTMALHRDPRLHSNRVGYITAALSPELRAQIMPLSDWYEQWLPMKDPPEHTRLRRLAAPAFQPRNLTRLERRVEEVVDRLLDRVMAAGEMEVAREFAFPVPRTIIGAMIGIPDEDLEQLMPWTHDIIALVGGQLNTAEAIARAQRSYDEMTAYLRGLIEERRRRPVEGEILSSLVIACDAEDRLSMDELVTMMSLITVAGYETTAQLITNGTLLLLQNPEQLALLRANPGLAPNAVEEMLRCEPSPSFNTRTVREPFEYQGHRFEAGQILYFVTVATNRDPARFPDPHRFDIARPDANANLTFGFGIHHCLGAALGRMEARIAFQRLVTHLPGMYLPEQPIVRHPSLAMRALERLVIRW